ncbi:MAG: hypothetical protein ACRDBG_27450 [Waterburya sp.]
MDNDQNGQPTMLTEAESDYKKVIIRQRLSVNKSLFENGSIKVSGAMLAVLPENPFLELNTEYDIKSDLAQTYVDKKWAEYVSK